MIGHTWSVLTWYGKSALNADGQVNTCSETRLTSGYRYFNNCKVSVCVHMCVCVCGHMVQWFVQSISSRNIAGSIPAEYGFSGWLPTAKCVCLSTCGGKKKKKKKKKGIVTGQKQPLRAVWCKTRLLNSGGQFDQICNLFGGAIPAQGLC